MDRAIARIKEIDAEQRAVRQLGPINLTVDQIRRAQSETFWGLALGGNPDLALSSDTDEAGDYEGFLADEIPYEPGPLPAERPATQPLPETNAEEWFFSDELDDTVAQKAASEEDDDE